MTGWVGCRIAIKQFGGIEPVASRSPIPGTWILSCSVEHSNGTPTMIEAIVGNSHITIEASVSVISFHLK